MAFEVHVFQRNGLWNACSQGLDVVARDRAHVRKRVARFGLFVRQFKSIRESKEAGFVVLKGRRREHQRMFGGLGVFADGMMFALVAYGELYMKSEPETEALFEAAGSTPFVYAREGKEPVKMGYYKLPEDAFEDSHDFLKWARLSFESARKAAATQTAAAEFLTFRLGAEEYGIDILRVQEIRSYEEPTRIANAPSFIKGVVNLRGVIVPVVDLRIKLNCSSVAYDSFTVVIVLNVHGRVVGAVVDSVSDVLELNPEQINAAPEMNTAMDTSYITGIASVAERMLILMDIEALMSSADMGLMDVHPSVQ